MIEVRMYDKSAYVSLFNDKDDPTEATAEIASGPTLIDALIEAEKFLRSDLDDIQARLHAEREQQKVGT